jgi:hypothetical protein
MWNSMTNKAYSMEMITSLETGGLYELILLVDNCVYPESDYLLKYSQVQPDLLSMLLDP